MNWGGCWRQEEWRKEGKWEWEQHNRFRRGESRSKQEGKMNEAGKLRGGIGYESKGDEWRKERKFLCFLLWTKLGFFCFRFNLWRNWLPLFLFLFLYFRRRVIPRGGEGTGQVMREQVETNWADSGDMWSMSMNACCILYPSVIQYISWALGCYWLPSLLFVCWVSLPVRCWIFITTYV